MHMSNYNALFKRSCDNLALRNGILPGEFRLELDKRRVANQTVRGLDNNGLSFLRSDVTRRNERTGESLATNSILLV